MKKSSNDLIIAFLIFLNIQFIYLIFELFQNTNNYNVVMFWTIVILLFIVCGYSLLTIRKVAKIKNKILINYKWGILFTFILIIGIMSLFDIFGIERYGRFGTVKPDFEKGIATISIVIIIFLFYKYFLKFNEDEEIKKESSYFLICPKCEESYSKNDIKDNKICLHCGNTLTELIGFYEKNLNFKKTFIKVDSKDFNLKIDVPKKLLHSKKDSKINTSKITEEWWEFD